MFTCRKSRKICIERMWTRQVSAVLRRMDDEQT